MTQLPSIKLNHNLAEQLEEMRTHEDIPAEWQDTPIGALITSQNFRWPVQTTGKPELLISTCIEFRCTFQVPRGYAYLIRRASGRLIGSEFSVGYTIAQGVEHLALVGHNDCGMAKIAENAPKIVDGLVNQGWKKDLAEEYVRQHASRYGISDEITALKNEYHRLRTLFPKLTIAPLFVCLYDSQLYLPKWYKKPSDAEAAQDKNAKVPDEVILNLPSLAKEMEIPDATCTHKNCCEAI